MNKQLLISFFAAASLILGGCSTSDDLFLGDQELAQQELEENMIQFGTFLGQSRQTRAGYYGGIDNDVLRKNSTTWDQSLGTDGANGFGVFAYYTGTNTYEQKNGKSYTLAPNFMYNEHIAWDGTNTRWWYADAAKVKYWPNEVTDNTTKGVDDQDNDADNNPATTDYTHGGNVSFFAYAPYVFSENNGNPVSGAANSVKGTTSGIVGFTTNTTTGDPWVKYKFDTEGQNVDLLWGTFYGTTGNVNTEGNEGVESNDGDVHPWPINRTKYGFQTDILKGYRVNADLTKQTTTGKVGFAFKHALAKVGGSSNTSSGSGSSKNGLMIVLDIDKDGAESGGVKPNTTIVTVKEITIKTEKVICDADNNGALDATSKYVTGGEFDLATGKWKVMGYTTDDPAGAMTHSITQAAGGESDAVLNTNIAEPASVNDFHTTESRLNNASTGPQGVLTSTAQNVYNSEASPLVFIPGTKPSFTVTVDYLVRTFDASLDAGVASGGEGTWTKVEQKISKKVTFADVVELNKQYSILIHLGLTSVKFEATVSDWALNTDDPNYDSDDDGIVDLHVEDAYTPINVSSLIMSINKTKIASTDGTAPSISEIYYYDGSEKKTATTATLELSDVTPSGWIALNGENTAIGTFSANSTFTDRTAKLKAKTTSPNRESEVVEIKQYGRIATSATINSISSATSYNLTKDASAETDFSISTVKASGYEATNTGAKGVAVSNQDVGSTEYVVKFIDTATSKEADWVEYADSKIKAKSENTGSARTARIYLFINGKYVLLDGPLTVTQAAP